MTPWRPALLAGLFALGGLAQAQSNALNFDGVDDKVDCGTGPTLAITGSAITLEAWIYPTSWKPATFQGNIIDSEAGYSGYMLRCGDNGKLDFTLGANTGWRQMISPANSLTLNTWQHVAGSYDGDSMRIYVNGVQIMAVQGIFNISTLNTPTAIGAFCTGPDRNFPGSIDEVRIWNTTVSGADILAHLYTSYCGSEDGLVAYYKFDQGNAGGANPTVTSLNDLTVNANDGTLTGFGLTGPTSNWVAGVTMADCSPVTCPAPTQVAISNATETGFDISWNDTGASGYEYEVRTSGAAGSGATGLATGGTVPSGNPAIPITGLATDAEYSVYVRSTCTGENSAWTVAVTVHVGYCVPESSSTAFYINNFFTTGGSANISNVASGLSTGGYGDFSSMSVSQNAGAAFSFTASYVGGSFFTRIWVDWNSDFDFNDAGELAFDGTNAAVTAVGSIIIPTATPAGNYRMRIRQANTGTPSACDSSSYGEAEDYTVHVTQGMGVGEIAASMGYAVHPNPASTTLYIATPNDAPVHVKVYDMVGTLVLEKEMARQLDIAQLATGSYILVATDTKGGNARYARFIKL